MISVMSIIFVGCSGNGDDKDTSGTGEETKVSEDGKKEDSSTDEGDSSDEVVTLKWITVGNGMPANYDAWKEHINPYLEEKIGVNIEMEVVAWGDWDNRRNVVVNSGEEFDILFTDGQRYLTEAKLGAFTDITELVQTAAPDLYEYLPSDYWDAVSVDGSIYSVPTYKDSSLTQYLVWDKAIADKYNVDIENLITYESLTDSLLEIKEGEGVSPYVLDRGGAYGFLDVYDNMGTGLKPLAVRYDDETRTVVNVFEQEEVLEQLEVIHEWYNQGIINPDAPTLEELPIYRTLFMAQGWPSAAKTTWGPNMGAEAVAVQFEETIVSNGTVRGSLNAISSGSKHPEKCLEFLQLVNLDSYVRDAFYYGLEGENFNYTDDGKIDKLNSDWEMAGYTQGTFFTVSQLAEDEFNQWDEVKELNENAKGSVLLGFDMDTDNVQNELANCLEVYNKYSSELLTGAREPRELVETISAELEAAGFNKLMEEAQNQIDAAYN